MPWRPRIDAVRLKRLNDELTSRLLRTREQLQIAQRQGVGLKVMLTLREKKIDALTVEVQRLRARLAITPPNEAAALAPELGAHTTAI